MTDIFEDAFPRYIALGMTYDQYWHGDTWLTLQYEKAHKIRTEIENEKLYVQGAYNFNAFSAALTNAMAGFSKKKRPLAQYLSKPLRLTAPTEKEKEKKKQKEIQAAKDKVVSYLDKLSGRFGKRSN
jgi:hypothetical protein